METKELEELLVNEVGTTEHNLMVYNDDHNTFDHVIDCLISICEHNKQQAEQCTFLVHYKGKCSVKVGSIKKLKPMLAALQMQDLSAEIK